MKRYLMPAFAAAVLGAAAWLAPAPAAAQGYQNYGQNQDNYSNRDYDQNRNYSQGRNSNQNGATAWGDPWLNENDFDYNRRHWLPRDDRSDRYGNNYDRNRGDYGRYQNDYGQNHGNWNRDDNRYGRYDQGYDRDRGFGRNYRPDNRYDEDDE